MTDDGYAPFELLLDAAPLGLVETTVRTALGHGVIRHRSERASTEATVFLHGAAGAWTTWTPLLQAATAAGTPFDEPVLLDLPGWGDSRVTDPGNALTVESISSFVRECLEALGYTSWRLVGHSLGGSIALHLASSRPDQAVSVHVVSPTIFSVIRSIDHPVRNFTEIPAFTMLLAIMRLLASLGPTGGRLVRVFAAIGAARPAFAPLFRHGRFMPESLVRATVTDMRPAAFAAAADATRGYRAAELWRDIRCPVVAQKGDRDIFVSDGDFVELAAAMPRAQLSVIPDCGHFGIIEWPFAVLAALRPANRPSTGVPPPCS